MLLLSASLLASIAGQQAYSLELPVRSLVACCATGPQKTIVVLVEFSDVKHTLEREKVNDYVFGDVNKYIREVSYGQTWLVGETTKWYQLPSSVSRYKISVHNNLVDRDRVQALVLDAVNAADADVNFADYKHVVIVVGASWDVYGMNGLDAKPGFLDRYPDIRTKSGEPIGSVAILPESPVFPSIFVHIFLILLGGVADGEHVIPILYDNGLQSTPGDFRGVMQFPFIYMGFWDIMSCFHVGPHKPPASISSFIKMRLGWIPSSRIAAVTPGQKASIVLDPLERDTSGILVLKIPLSSSVYYLVENRQKIGYDAKVLPSSGVLIMKVDESIPNGRGPVRLIDADPSAAMLNGAAFDVGAGKNSTFVDARNNLAVIMLSKRDLSYQIHVTTAGESSKAVNVWNSLTTAENAILQAERDGRTVGLSDARLALEQAARAFSDGDYEKAESAGRSAKSTAEKATKPEITLTTTSPEVDTPAPAPTGGMPWAIPAIVLAIAVVAAAVFLRSRRSK